MNQEGDSRLSPDSITPEIERLEGLALAVLSKLETLRGVPEIDPERGINLREEVRRFEAELIRRVLRRTGGHQRRAAAILGLKETTLCVKIKLYKLQAEEPPPACERPAPSG
jgi:DNA-binding NtrC family response regulator